MTGWIGLNDIAAAGTWVWSDGTSTDYLNWDEPEPNGADAANCVHINPWEYTGPTGQWNDETCWQNYSVYRGYPGSYICMNQVPRPSRRAP